MSIMVGNGYSYVTCNAKGCNCKSAQCTGENDGQRDISDFARKNGWQEVITKNNRLHYCPDHAFKLN